MGQREKLRITRKFCDLLPAKGLGRKTCACIYGYGFKLTLH